MSWTPERLELLLQLERKGLSARQIAEEHNRRFRDSPVGRNAVIGKLHRVRKGVVSETVQNSGQAADTISILKLPKGAKSWMCRTPRDELGRHGFYICGKTVQPGQPMCAECLRDAIRRERSRM